MLKGIKPIVSPKLLKVLCEMGHGDEIVIADANFPSETMGKKVVRADGICAPDMLDAVLSLIPLDQYDSNNFVLMKVCEGDPTVPAIWETYKEILSRYEKDAVVSYMERFDYYERARKAYAVIATGETAIYANIILKKGVVI